MKTNFFKITAMSLLLAGMMISCGKENEERETSVCNLQTERRAELDIHNMETHIIKELPENIYQYNKSSFIYEKDGIAILYIITGSIVIKYEICNFSNYVSELIISNDELSVVISGKVFEPSRDHGINPATYVFFDLELTSLILE
ncbi:MAG: hypothetical protein LBH30_00530 [Prevotellaceae bacterium]|jgi:hypothetical protein|nr:hypothetical protein [Prevotellaceae bacterium]